MGLFDDAVALIDRDELIRLALEIYNIDSAVPHEAEVAEQSATAASRRWQPNPRAPVRARRRAIGLRMGAAFPKGQRSHPNQPIVTPSRLLGEAVRGKPVGDDRRARFKLIGSRSS